MSYAKYFEDNLKISDDRKYMAGKSFWKKIYIPEVYPCYYCGRVFPSKDNLYDHIRQDHNIVRPIIKINDTIAQDTNYILCLQSIIIYPYGINCTVVIDGETLYHPDIHEIDITCPVQESLDTIGECVIAIGEHEYRISYCDAEMIRDNRILDVIGRWEEETAYRKTISRCYDSSAFSYTENRYLDGFMNYYLACNTPSGKEKSHRYDDAFAILSEYKNISALGRCVLKTIAFRRNYINSLTDLCDQYDEFMEILLYYNPIDSIENIALTNYDDQHKQQQLYIEDDVRKSMDLILFAKRQEKEKVEYILREQENQLSFDDNAKDRYNFVCAKYLIQEQRYEEAADYTEDILNPILRYNIHNLQKGI